MLSAETISRLNLLGIEASHSRDFVSGLKLMQLVSQVFYEGENQALSSKLRIGDESKTGNNVLNVNIILNHLKKDPNIHLDQATRQATAFKIIQQQQAMIQLIEWILSNNKQSQMHSASKTSPHRDEENQFQNLYFVSSLEKKDYPLNDSLQDENPQNRVVRKGSFKMLRPKVNSAGKESSQEKARGESLECEQPLKQLTILNSNTEHEDKEDLQCRMTIPKMYERPPLYRPKQKEQKCSQVKIEKKELMMKNYSGLIDRQQILNTISSINKQMPQEEKSMCKNVVISERRKRLSERKIFKMDIPEMEEKRKKMLLQWLIGINLLNSSSVKFVNELHRICKDGVVFMEVVNYYRGRGKEMCYFKQPKRSAEMHSNFQKLFTALAQQIGFKSQLLHQYQYFIPEAQPNAFWNLLASIHQCFNRRVQPKDPNIDRYEDSISRKMNRQTFKKKILNESISYHEIKYNSALVSKEAKSNSSSVERPRRDIPTPNSRLLCKEEATIEQTTAPERLVQNEEPTEESYLTERGGYKEMYLCKFKNMETPQKCKSFCSNSLSKSRRKGSMRSSKRESKPVIPSISLQMQMRVLQYLGQFQIEEGVQQLFKDPYRNGVLLCEVVKRSLGVDCFASRKPKSIEDCRNNYILAIDALKSHISDFNPSFQAVIQELVKGQRTLLYGVIWELVRGREKEANRYRTSTTQAHQKNLAEQQTPIEWIRSIERSCPEMGSFKIRNESALFAAITGTDFLFQYSWFITGKRAVRPAYERPINDIQKESNLKKVLGYLMQSKIIRSDYLWKTRSLVRNQNNLLRDLVSDLVNHFNGLFKKQQRGSVNFVKYLTREDSQSRQKLQEKLETTMANQTIPQNSMQVQSQKAKIEIPWMRKLGFCGNLQLNNGVVLCRLMSKLCMKTIEGLNERPLTRAESLGNIRRALKDTPKFKWDQYDILECDHKRTLQIYAFLKEKYKHAYAMRGI